MDSEPTKEVRLEMPKSLHAEVKSRCALEGVPMKDGIIHAIERAFRTPTTTEARQAQSA